ncbi:hypothetical protein JCM8097_003977 [Rhodosporidiobolus ruineniae]
MSTSPLQYDLPRRYLRPPTAEQQRLLNARRDVVEASPLSPGDVLPFRLLKRYRRARFDPSSADASIRTPVSQRPFCLPLYNLLTRAEHTRESLSLRLVVPVQAGRDRWSQVWMAKVGELEEQVVVKLLVESLYPFPLGESVDERTGRYDWWDAETLACRVFEGQHRLQDLGRTIFGFSARDILVLKETDDLDDVRLVFLDFGNTFSVEHYLDILRLDAQEYARQGISISAETKIRRWRGVDEANVHGVLSEILGRAMYGWSELEAQRNRLSLTRD